ncbi:MAG: cytochrome c biogenesis CcdA family protein [Chitinispirillaceae bacterium]
MQETISIALVFAAGLTSVLSPCVLPVIPIVVTGSEKDHKYRPFLIIGGLSASFVLMGILTSLFGSVVGPKMLYIEKAVGVMVIGFGILLVFNVNPFKYMGFMSRFAQKSRGRAGGLFLGFILGVVWIPCIGPMLSGVLSMVAAEGKIVTGTFLLLVYSLGFSVPLLVAGYASHFFRRKLGGLRKYPNLMNMISGGVLIGLGMFILFKGVTAMNF